MINKYYIATLCLAIAVLQMSCISGNNPTDNTAAGNMHSLWTTLDERYCYFDEKQIDWDSVYNVYSAKVKNIDNDNEHALFDTLSAMVNCLRDGHVNLVSPFDMSHYTDFYSLYPHNFSSTLLYSKYLSNYRTAGSLIYDAIDSEYGYIRCSSFADSFSQLNLYYVLSYLVREKVCKGLIVDVRDNTGGSIENALQLASVFFASDTTIGYTQHKTGKRHIDLSEPEPIEISKKDYSGMYVSLPVAVLTNRLSYSATNLFACAMKSCDKCIIIGDRTGGGGGIPLSYELPNGWLIRFSSVKMTNTEHKSIEDGIEPDIKIDLISTDVDDIIEEAKKQIDSFSQQQNKQQRK